LSQEKLFMPWVVQRLLWYASDEAWNLYFLRKIEIEETIEKARHALELANSALALAQKAHNHAREALTVADDAFKRAKDASAIANDAFNRTQHALATVNRLQSHVRELSSVVSRIRREVNSLSSRVDDIQSVVNSLSSRIHNLQSIVDDLQSRANDLSSRMEEAFSRIKSLESDINKAFSDINTLFEKANELSSNINEAFSQLDSLWNDINNFRERLNSAMSDLSQIQSWADRLKAFLNEIGITQWTSEVGIDLLQIGQKFRQKIQEIVDIWSQARSQIINKYNELRTYITTKIVPLVNTIKDKVAGIMNHIGSLSGADLSKAKCEKETPVGSYSGAIGAAYEAAWQMARLSNCFATFLEKWCWEIDLGMLGKYGFCIHIPRVDKIPHMVDSVFKCAGAIVEIFKHTKLAFNDAVDTFTTIQLLVSRIAEIPNKIKDVLDVIKDAIVQTVKKFAEIFNIQVPEIPTQAIPSIPQLPQLVKPGMLYTLGTKPGMQVVERHKLVWKFNKTGTLAKVEAYVGTQRIKTLRTQAAGAAIMPR